MHLTALRAAGARRSTVTVKLIAEGSEVQGTGGLDRRARPIPGCSPPAIVVGDTGNSQFGILTVTAAVRRLALAEVTVQTLEGNLCSGLSGGAAPDALAALTRLLASLHDDTGAPAVQGPGNTGEWRGLQYPERDFRAGAKALPGVGLVGTGTAADRVWARPTVTVLGIDCPPVEGATPALQETARALVSLRVPPGTDARDAAAALIRHPEAAAPGLTGDGAAALFLGEDAIRQEAKLSSQRLAPPILGGVRSPWNWRLIPRPRGRAPTRAAFRHETATG
jgi:acetylornithine deacetylase/succinyl-diaminopimelate desuccinylase-like protein